MNRWCYAAEAFAELPIPLSERLAFAYVMRTKLRRAGTAVSATNLDGLLSDVHSLALGGLGSLPSGDREGSRRAVRTSITGPHVSTRGENKPYQLRMTAGETWSVRIY